MGRTREGDDRVIQRPDEKKLSICAQRLVQQLVGLERARACLHQGWGAAKVA